MIPVFRRKPVRSPRRIAETPSCIVTDESTRIVVRIAGRTMSWWIWNGANGASLTRGGHWVAFRRTLKYAAKRPEKNITSETMNRIIPRIGLLIPRWPCARLSPMAATCGVRALLLAATVSAPP